MKPASSNAEASSSNPLLSIVLTSYTTERLRDIFELLDAIRAQTYPNIETIFVVERSKELFHRVKSYMEELMPNAKIIFNYGERGEGAARNLGVKEAKGEIVAFLDDDTIPFRDWAEEMVKTYMKDNSIIGVTGPALPLWEDESMNWFPVEFYWIFSCTAWFSSDKVTEVRHAWGMNMSFKREDFNLCGGFLSGFGPKGGTDPIGSRDRLGRLHMPNEDLEFSLRAKARAGKRIVYNPNVKIMHKVYKFRTSWSFIRSRSYIIGYGRGMMHKLNYANTRQEDLLKSERQLLTRVFLKLVPSILKESFWRPSLALRKALLTIVVLMYSALGYCTYYFHALMESIRSGKGITYGRKKASLRQQKDYCL